VIDVAVHAFRKGHESPDPEVCETLRLMQACQGRIFPVGPGVFSGPAKQFRFPQNFHHGRGPGGSGGTMSFTFMTLSWSSSISYVIDEARFLSESSPNV
jgi:hypothetical protein